MKAAWLVPVLLLVAAQDKPAEKKPPALNVGGIAQDGGTVTGIVKFKGPQPERKPLSDIKGNAFCKECHKDGPPLSEKWVFGKNGSDATLRNVLVYVSKGLEGKTFEVPKAAVVLDQVNCVYTPHVVSAMTGQKIEIRNSDATLHNVLCSPQNNKGFNEGMAVKGGTIEKVFEKPEMRIDVRCFMHPWMYAFIHVLPNPFHAVTQEDGTFTIRGLPPGEYEISVLHESSRFASEPATVTVKVAAGETRKVEFVFEDKQ